MAFKFGKLKEEDRREYVLGWPRTGDKWTPTGGLLDLENNIRFIMYANGYDREPCDEYQCIYDYKGIVYIVYIKETIENNKYCYYLNFKKDFVKAKPDIYSDEIIQALREAVKMFANREFCITGDDDLSDEIEIKF